MYQKKEVYVKKIPRITFDDIFKEEKKNISNLSPDCCLFSFIKNRLEINYYSKNYLENLHNFDTCLSHYIWKGYFCGCKFNKNDNHSMINICKPIYDIVIHKVYDNEIIFLFSTL